MTLQKMKKMTAVTLYFNGPLLKFYLLYVTTCQQTFIRVLVDCLTLYFDGPQQTFY